MKHNQLKNQITNNLHRLSAILTLIFTLGITQVWGATLTYGIDGFNLSSGVYTKTSEFDSSFKNDEVFIEMPGNSVNGTIAFLCSGDQSSRYIYICPNGTKDANRKVSMASSYQYMGFSSRDIVMVESKPYLKFTTSDDFKCSAIKFTVGTSIYYYRGSTNGWGAMAMSVSEDGYYEYIQQSSNTNQFKIATSTESYDYNYSYVTKNFHGTDVSNIGDYSKDNAYCWQGGTYYILVYYPSTAINNTNKPIICASTTLPNDAPEVFDPTAWSIIGDLVGGNDNANDVFFDENGDATVSNVTSGTKKFKLRKDQAWTETKGWSELNGKITVTDCSVADASDYNNINLIVSATKNLAFHFDGTNLSITATSPAPAGYSITYNCDGGETCPENVASATNIPDPLTTLTKAGYTFDGWFTDSEKTVAAVAGAALTGDITLYAKWTKLPDVTLYQVVFSNGFDAIIDNANNTVTAYYMQGAIKPTLSTWSTARGSQTHAGASSCVIDGDNIVVTPTSGTARTYALSLTEIAPYTGTGTSQTLEGQSWVKAGAGWDAQKGWMIRRNTKSGDSEEQAMRHEQGLTRLYLFLGPGESVELTAGTSITSDRAIKVYVNGVENALTVAPKKDTNKTINGLNTSGNNLIAIVSNQTSGDAGIASILLTSPSAPCTAPTSVSITGEYHYFPGDDISLTATPTGGSGEYSYQWYKNGTAEGNKIVGKTAANLVISGCTDADAGAYYCKVSTGDGCETFSSNFNAKILRVLLKDGSTETFYALARAEGKIATYNLSLNGNKTYSFKINDGGLNYYGNTGTMTSSNSTNWSLDADAWCGILTTKTGTYTLKIDYTDIANLKATVAYPSSDQAADKVIYFDNSATDWSNLYYRIGHNTHNTRIAMTQVPGTTNLWKVVTGEYKNFLAWHIANNGGGGGSVYNTTDNVAITNSIAYIGDAVTDAITITPDNDSHSGGSESINNNCQFYAYTKTDGMKSHTATISSYSNGTVTVAYTDVAGANQNFTSGNATLAHTCQLTITATPNTHYALKSLKVNDVDFTSGTAHTLTADATITAEFAAPSRDCETLAEGEKNSANTGIDASVGTITVDGGTASDGYLKLSGDNKSIVITAKSGESIHEGDELTVVVYNKSSSTAARGFKIGSTSYTELIPKTSEGEIVVSLTASDIADGTVTLKRTGSDDRYKSVKIERCSDQDCKAAAITQQPTSTTVGVGEQASLSVSATGTRLQYEWFTCDTEEGEFTAASGVNAASTYTITPLVAGTRYYKCVVSAACGEPVTTDVVSITATKGTPVVTWSVEAEAAAGSSIPVQVTTTSDAEFTAEALTATAGTLNVTKNGKTISGTLEIPTSDDVAEITLTFTTLDGTAYAANVDTKTITITHECPEPEDEAIYSMYVNADGKSVVNGGTTTFVVTSTQTKKDNKVYHQPNSGAYSVTLANGNTFAVGDKLIVDVAATKKTSVGFFVDPKSDMNQPVCTLEVSVNNTAGTAEYTVQGGDAIVGKSTLYIKRRSSDTYFYGMSVVRAGSNTKLTWDDDELYDGAEYRVAPDADNFFATATANTSGAITYSSATESVATINSTTGEVAVRAQGSTLISATVEAVGECFPAKTITFTLLVAADCEAPEIKTQPAGATYEQGATATALSVKATGESLTYQWYKNTTNSTEGATAIGTSSTYIPLTTAGGTTYYYCVVSSGMCSTVSDIVKVVVKAPCTLPTPKIIITDAEVPDCWSEIHVNAVAQDGSNLTGGTGFQWYDEDGAISGATSATYTINEVGTYYVEYVGDGCSQESSNKAYVTRKEPSVKRLAPLQYYHNGKEYSTQMKDRHLLVVQSLKAEGDKYQLSAKKNGAVYDIANLDAALSAKTAVDNVLVDTIMLDLNEMPGNLAEGDILTITATPYSACGELAEDKAVGIDVHVIDETPTLAFIVSGASEEGTKDKSKHVVGGDFLTGYNKADLKKQTAKSTVSGEELPLYTALKDAFRVTPVNGYAPFSIFNYEPYDIVLLSDFPKTEAGSTTESRKASAKALDELSQVVDYRPFFSLKTFMADKDKLPSWQSKGFVGNPVDTKKTQLWMNIKCNSHTMFAEVDFSDVPTEEGSGEFVFTMLDGPGFDVKNSVAKGLQGFPLSNAKGFVQIATTHYNATAELNSSGKIEPTEKGDDDQILVASCERQKNTEARMLLLAVNADATSMISTKGKQVIISALKYLLITDPEQIVDCSLTPTPADDGNVYWDEDHSYCWPLGQLPTGNSDVRIKYPCIVNMSQALAGDIRICHNYTETIDGNPVEHIGKLIINPNAGLAVNGNIYRIEDGQYFQTMSTQPDELVVLANEDFTGALAISGEDGSNQATIEMCMKAKKVGTQRYWQYIAMPVEEMDFNTDFYGAYTYIHNEATSGYWTRKRNGSGKHFAAYGLTENEPTKRTFRGHLASSENRTFELTNSTNGGNNMIGNSWTAPINIGALQKSDFVNAEATIYIYNTGFDATKGETAEGSSPGQWLSIPVEATDFAAWEGLKVIPSQQAFEVHAGNGGGSLTLDYNRVVMPQNGAALSNEPLRAPRRAAAHEDAVMMRIDVTGEKTRTSTYLIEGEQFTTAFDNGWDGYFFEGDGRSADFYSLSQLGNMAVNALPSVEGTILGFVPNADPFFTITFAYDGDEEYYLRDIQTNATTLIKTGYEYMFSVSETDMVNRFVIERAKSPQTPTGLTNIDSSDGAAVLLYDVSGRRCAEPSAQGVYIIYGRGENGSWVKKVIR